MALETYLKSRVKVCAVLTIRADPNLGRDSRQLLEIVQCVKEKLVAGVGARPIKPPVLLQREGNVVPSDGLGSRGWRERDGNGQPPSSGYASYESKKSLGFGKDHGVEGETIVGGRESDPSKYSTTPRSSDTSNEARSR